MDKDTLIDLVRIQTGETDRLVLSYYLEMAQAAVLQRAYPFRDDVTVVPAKYISNVANIAIYLLNKRGAEGETTHNEGDVHRTWETAGIPAKYLHDIIPQGAVFGEETDDAPTP